MSTSHAPENHLVIILNGESHPIPVGCTIAELLTATGGGGGSAVVVDEDIIPRIQWESYQLSPGQHVELVTAVPGG